MNVRTPDPEGNEKRFAALEQDTALLKSGQSSILQVFNARFDGIDARIDGLIARIDGLIARIDGLIERFDGRFDGVVARFDAIGARFDSIDDRFVALHAMIATLATKTDLAELRSDFSKELLRIWRFIALGFVFLFACVCLSLLSTWDIKHEQRAGFAELRADMAVMRAENRQKKNDGLSPPISK